MSVIDLRLMQDATESVRGFADALKNTDLNYLRSVRDQLQFFDSNSDYDLTPEDSYIDLMHFAELVSGSPYPDLNLAARKLLDTEPLLIRANYVKSGYISVTGGLHACDLSDAHGISVFLPPAGRPDSEYYPWYRTTSEIAFPRESGWALFLEWFVEGIRFKTYLPLVR